MIGSMSRLKSMRRACADVKWTKAPQKSAADKPKDAARQIAILIFLIIEDALIVVCGIIRYDVSYITDLAFISFRHRTKNRGQKNRAFLLCFCSLFFYPAPLKFLATAQRV